MDLDSGNDSKLLLHISLTKNIVQKNYIINLEFHQQKQKIELFADDIQNELDFHLKVSSDT